MDNFDTKIWAARIELGQALQRNMAGAYTAALELLRLTKQGEYGANGLAQMNWLVNVMGSTNDVLTVLPMYLEEAREYADPERRRMGPKQQMAAEMPLAGMALKRY